MKKVLALVLVAVLAIGMSATAFGATRSITGFASSYTLADGVEEVAGADFGTGYDGRHTQTYYVGDRYALDAFGLNIWLWDEMFNVDYFNYGNVNGTGTTYETQLVVDLDAMNAAGCFRNVVWANVGFFNQSYKSITTWAQLQAVLASNGDYYLPTDFVKSGPAATITEADVTGGAGALFNAYDRAGFIKEIEHKAGAPYSALAFYNGFYYNTTANAFTNVSTAITGTVLTGTGTTGARDILTSDEIRENKITMGTQLKASSEVIKKIELVRNEGKIRFELVDEFVSTGSKDFEAVIYLIFNGKRADAQHVTIVGTIKNPIIEVYADHDSVDIHEGYVAKAIEFNPSISVDIGNGVTIHTKMFKNKLYYGKTTRDADEDALVVFKKYPAVDNVVTLKTIGLNSVGDYITLSTDYAGYFVYNADLEFLGKADEHLDFSTKYYLAYEKLDIETDDEDEYEEEEEPITAPPVTAENPATGGDAAATNVNMNPGTGR